MRVRRGARLRRRHGYRGPAYANLPTAAAEVDAALERAFRKRQTSTIPDGGLVEAANGAQGSISSGDR